MKLFDAHCHLQPPAAFERAAAAGVEKIAVCGTSSNDWNKILQCSELFPQIFPMIGIHPWFVGCRAGAVTPPESAIADRGYNWKKEFQCLEKQPQIVPILGIHPWFAGCRAGAVTPPESAIADRGCNWKKEFQCLEKLLRENPRAGIGETGLDFQEKFTNRAEQEECFAAHLDLARELNRPVTVHCVQAWGRLIEILREHPAPRVLLHAFGGAPELIPELVDLNCRFSFCGLVTNPNAKRVRASAAAVPPDRLLIETDSPDFPPAGCLPPNESAHLIHVARAVAELRGISVEELAEITFLNATQVFDAI